MSVCTVCSFGRLRYLSHFAQALLPSTINGHSNLESVQPLQPHCSGFILADLTDIFRLILAFVRIIFAFVCTREYNVWLIGSAGVQTIFLLFKFLFLNP